jgi:hypothetical protein
VRRIDGSNLRYTKDNNPAVRSREDSLSQSRGNMAFLSTHTGRCHAQHPPLNTTTNISLSPASGGLFSGAYKNPPTPIAGNNLYAPRPRMNVPTYSPFLKPQLHSGKLTPQCPSRTPQPQRQSASSLPQTSRCNWPRRRASMGGLPFPSGSEYGDAAVIGRVAWGSWRVGSMLSTRGRCRRSWWMW